MRAVLFPSLWEGLGEGAKLEAHRSSPKGSESIDCKQFFRGSKTLT
jgi:hypothetical protein